MKTLAWLVVAALAVVGAASAVTRTIAVGRVLQGADAAELSPRDVENLHQLAAFFGVSEESEHYRVTERDTRYASIKYNSQPAVVLLHVAPGAIFLLAAPLQLSGRLRRRYAAVHRSLGYLLLVLAIPFAITGLYLAVRDPVFGRIGQSAAVLAGLLFINAGVRAYLAIRRGDRARHREWMLRFLALGYGIAVIRVIGTVVLAFVPVGPRALGGPLFWIGWSASALAAEWWIRRSSIARPGARPVLPPRPALS
jgi:uncharacterized membrane protein